MSVDLSSNKFEPHRIPFYLYELATIFHSYWSKGNEDDRFKFIENGKVISEKIIKSCTETETLNKQNFLVTWLTDERYQNSVIMVFMGILENL